MAQLTLRKAGEGISVKEFTEGATLAQVVGTSDGVFRVNGSTVSNPGSFRAAEGSIVDWSPAAKSARA